MLERIVSEGFAAPLRSPPSGQLNAAIVTLMPVTDAIEAPKRINTSLTCFVEPQLRAFGYQMVTIANSI
ncbi:MAG: hypothetical protein ABJH63_07300 [Rhizobiaceae bacterium]